MSPYIFLPHLQLQLRQISCSISVFLDPCQNNFSTHAFQEEICLFLTFQPRTVVQPVQSALCSGTMRQPHTEVKSNPRIYEL
ncbi:hypothetical protein H8958_011589, partial [Nasalis larvatus]